MKILRIIRKIIEHPLNEGNAWNAIVRFFRWQLGMRIIGRPVIFDWFMGLRFIVSKGEEGMTGNIYHGLTEFPDMAFTLHTLRNGDLFLDVGANAGSYTLLACGIVGCNGIAFEPIPETHARLINNINLNLLQDKVITHNLALGRETGELLFTRHLDDTNHVVPIGEPEKGARSVMVVPLDTIIGDAAPSLIKIDVEGYELAVLEGAHEVLKNLELNALIVEINGSSERYGYEPEGIVTKLGSYGFRPFRYEPSCRKLEQLDSSNPEKGNTIFVRNITLARERIASAPSIKIFDKEF